MSEARAQLEAIFREALRAVDPGATLARALELLGAELGDGAEPLSVIAAGKAAAGMALALERALPGRMLRGMVVTRDPPPASPASLVLRVAGHPLPDARSEAAGRAALAVAAGAADTLVVLLSGGASALLTAPLPGLSLADLTATTALLQRSGAEIGELNCVRKHLTAVSGGRLAAATHARRVLVFVVSDVLGDDVGTIGSGPCAGDPGTYADALAVLSTRGLLARAPPAVVEHLQAGARGERPESLRPGDRRLAHVRHELVATNRDALAAAAAAGRAQGCEARIVTDRLRGEARILGARFAALARAAHPRGCPLLVLAGGEPTVTVRGAGRGGRAQELALAAALGLEGETRIVLLAAGTDGSDGPTDAAGAFADGGTALRGAALGVSARSSLEQNDAYGFFAREGGCLRTGPTGTNVMDLVLVRVEPRL